MDKSKSKQVFQLITDSLKGIISKGLDMQLLENAMSSLELKSREKGDYWVESLLWRASAAWAFNEDISVAVDIGLQYSLLREKLSIEPNYMENMVDTFLLKNSHKAL